ncbi:MAG: RND family transporter [Gammaproteobacteria bacterium]
MERFANFIVNQRYLLLAALLAITGAFTWFAMGTRIDTDFSSLHPKDHPFIHVNRQYAEQYGSPLTVFMMLRVRDGNIYNPKTLKKVRELTKALDALPGVNHNQVVSIASRKVKVLKIEGSYIQTDVLMPEVLPATEDEFQAFRRDVSAAGVMGSLVSTDTRVTLPDLVATRPSRNLSTNANSTLLTANFIEGRFQLDEIFKRLRELKSQYSDENTEIFLAGQPVLMGWIHNYLPEIFAILGVTMLLMFVMLYIHVRDWSLTILPIVGTVMSAIWGIGFAAIFGWKMSPLILIIPVLLMARSLSHGVQRMERIVEIEDQGLTPEDKGKVLIRALFGSGVLGIVTDAMGILVIGISSIPLLHQLSGFGSFWALSNILTVTILISVIVAIFGSGGSKRVKARLESGRLTAILDRLGRFVPAHPGRILTVFLIVALVSIGIATQIHVGDVHPGTPVLWPESNFNVAVREINRSFSGTDEFQVIVETDAQDPGVRDPAVLKDMRDFQRNMEKFPEVRGSTSFADFIPIVRRRLNGNHVKWESLPNTLQESAQYAHLLLRGTDPGDFTRFVSEDYKTAAVTLSLQDHRGETLRRVVAHIRDYLSAKHLDGNDSPRFRLASGLGGVLAAVNEEVGSKQLLIFLLVAVVIFALCLYAFRSWMAVSILIAPLIVTNFVVMSVMVYMGIGLDVNTMPVVSIGMGVGIDYGIYLLTRILQEHRLSGDYGMACAAALRTTGRAILFTAGIMVISSGLWYFLTSFRFLAEMGLLLSLIMAINMIGTLLVIPAAMTFFKPDFRKEARILQWE